MKNKIIKLTVKITTTFSTKMLNIFTAKDIIKAHSENKITKLKLDFLLNLVSKKSIDVIISTIKIVK